MAKKAVLEDSDQEGNQTPPSKHRKKTRGTMPPVAKPKPSSPDDKDPKPNTTLNVVTPKETKPGKITDRLLRTNIAIF